MIRNIKTQFKVIVDVRKGFCIHHNVEYYFDNEIDMLNFLEDATEDENIICIKKARKVVEYIFEDRVCFNKK